MAQVTDNSEVSPSLDRHDADDTGEGHALQDLEHSPTPRNNAESTSTTTTTVMDDLPHLHTPHANRLFILIFGLLMATLDLCILPIVYYYALNYGTRLSLQDSRPSLIRMIRLAVIAEIGQFSPSSLVSMVC